MQIRYSSAIHFDFSQVKSLEAMGYLIGAVGGVDKVALTKLLYIADRDHFISFGYPITGDRQSALPMGPVPSNSLSLLDGEFGLLGGHDPSAVFCEKQHHFTIKADPGTKNLSPSEQAVLSDVVGEYGAMAKRTWDIVNATHEFPEYKEVYREGTSTPIPYELMLKHYDKSRYIHGRPVVSQATSSRMRSPFRESDSDL